MRIETIPCLSDNYGYLVVCDRTHEAVIVDASESAPILKALEAASDVKLKAVWSTHHHHDHVGGNEDVRAKYGVDVYGHASDEGRLPAQTKFLESGDSFTLGELQVRVHHIPGHTLGAIAYVVRDGDREAVFTGDTMFVAGCGRMFEGTPEQMYGSLSWIAALGPETLVYCGHEYTVNNLRFAESIDAGNADVAAAVQRAKVTRAEGKPTVPSTIGEEKRINPFLRPGSAEIREALGIAADADDVTAFAAIRKAKDGFR